MGCSYTLHIYFGTHERFWNVLISMRGMHECFWNVLISLKGGSIAIV